MNANEIEAEAREAFAPVLRDVAATTDVGLTLRYTTDEYGPIVIVSGPDGGAQVRFEGNEDADERVDIAAREVQDLVIEELW